MIINITPFELTVGEANNVATWRKVLAIIGYFAINTAGPAAGNEWLDVGSQVTTWTDDPPEKSHGPRSCGPLEPSVTVKLMWSLAVTDEAYLDISQMRNFTGGGGRSSVC